MKYVQHAGDYDIEDRGALLARAARLGRPLWGPGIGAFVVAGLATLARLAGPLAVRAGIDQGIADSNKRAVTIAALIYLGLLLVQYVLSAISRYGISWVGERYLLRLPQIVFFHLIRIARVLYSKSQRRLPVALTTSDIESLQ